MNDHCNSCSATKPLTCEFTFLIIRFPGSSPRAALQVMRGKTGPDLQVYLLLGGLISLVGPMPPVHQRDEFADE